VRTLALVVAAALALPAHPFAQAAAAAPAQADALALDPATLPRAPAGRWSAWKPSDALPEALQAPMRDGTRSYFEGDYARAVALYWELLRREPDFPPALYQLGVTYFRLRRYGDCARTFERFLAAVPSAVGATQALAHSYYSLGEYERALAHYQAVLAADTDSVEALRGFALSHMRLGRPERALELFDACLAKSPEHLEVLFWRGQTLFDLGRLEEARAAAEAARDVDAFDPRAWFLLSQVQFELGEEEAAEAAEARFGELNLHVQKVRTLEGLLLYEPRRMDLWRRLLEVERSAGNTQGAIESVQRCLRAIPGDLTVRLFALESYAVLGERARAMEVADATERDFAENADAWLALRDFYGSLGDRVRQVRAGERYLRLGGDPRR
jgi:tetratricopeptide (TPR) repeat protein